MAAVPETVTVKDMSGMYAINKTLSDSSEEMLVMQNVSWIVRQAVYWSYITVTLKHSTDENGNSRIDTKQVSTGGLTSEEVTILDGQEHEKDHSIWGKLKSTSKYVKLDDVDDEYLKEGWSQDCVEGEVILNWVESISDSWTAKQIIGYAVVDGVRRHVRKSVGKKGDQVINLRMIYDWVVQDEEHNEGEPEGIEEPSL